MKITSVKIKGNRRLMLSGIEEIEYTPEAFIQIILGTNGSGKSTLMRILSPLPANPADYVKGGFEEVVIEHKGNIYKVVSDFRNKPEHFFYLNDENLNEGRTITVQRDYVLKHFDLTEELFSLMIGELKFTDLPALKRRDWIIKLSKTDMSFALDIFNKLKVSYRDLQGVLKHLTKRIGEESVKLPNDEELDRLSIVNETLRKRLLDLMSLKDPNTKDPSFVKKEIELLKQEIENNSRIIVKADLPDLSSFGSYDNLLAMRDKSKERIGILSGLLYDKQEEFSGYGDIIAALEEEDNLGCEQLGEKVNSLKAQIEKLKDKVPPVYHFLGFTNIDTSALNATLNSCSNMLFQILENLEDNSNDKYTSDKKKLSQERVAEIHSLLNKIEMENIHVNHVLSHYEENSTECPRCKHTFLPNMKGKNKDTLQKDLDVSLTKKLELTKEKNELEEYLESFKTYSSGLNALASVFSTSPELSIIWENFKEVWSRTKSPRFCENFLRTVSNYSIISLEANRLIASLEKEELTFKALKENNAENVKNIKDKVTAIENKIISLQQELSLENINLKLQEKTLTTLKKIEESTEVINRCYDKVNLAFQEHVKILRNNSIEELIKETQIALAQNENAFNSFKQIKTIMEEMIQRKEETIKDLEAFDLLIKELSPTEGLIADHVNTFMSYFLGNINKVISDIWTYDLIVLPCALEKGELNYKFPFTVKLGERPINDISEGSSSQRDIFNFAFKVVAILLLEMNDYPLYLDELAPTLDEQHRLNIIMFVKQFIELRNATQLFMISHYAAMHGALSNAQFCVLDSSNIITLPDTYNKHLTINRVPV